MKWQMPPHPLTNFEIQKYYQNKSEFNGVHLNLTVFIWDIIYLKEKGGEYVVNLDEYKSVGTLWKTLHVNGNNMKLFDIFGDEHIPKILSQTWKEYKHTIHWCNFYIWQILLYLIYWFYVKR